MKSQDRQKLLADLAAIPQEGDRKKALTDFCRKWTVPIRGLYRHYKGALYVIHGLTIFEEALTIHVSYMTVGGSHWTRTVENFLAEVEPGLLRFKRMSNRSFPVPVPSAEAEE